MSIPTDSVGPTPPSGTSDPVTLKGWFKRISDWIVALSPAGSTVYDTGWVDCSLTAGITGSIRVRRIGRIVYMHCEAQTSWPATAYVAGTVPAAFRPGLVKTTGFVALWVGGVVGYGAIQTDGSITVRRGTAGSDFLVSHVSWTQ